MSRTKFDKLLKRLRRALAGKTNREIGAKAIKWTQVISRRK